MNKGLKIVMGILITLLILWAIMFLVDYIRVSNFEEPIFVIHTNILKDGGSYIGYGLRI